MADCDVRLRPRRKPVRGYGETGMLNAECWKLPASARGAIRAGYGEAGKLT